MSRARLVLVEGLPGSGKSTTAHLLSLWLDRHAPPARWHYEHEVPHPIFHYPEVQEALDHGRLRDGLFDEAIVRWQAAANDVAAGTWIVLESSFLQTAIHPMLLLDWPESRIAAFVDQVRDAIAAVAPALIWIREPDVARAIADTIERRGAWFGEFLEHRVAQSSFGRARDLSGFAGLVRYLETYRDLAERLIARAELLCVTIDAGSTPKSRFVDIAATGLGLPAPIPPETTVEVDRFTGQYKDAASDDVWVVVADGGHLFLDGTPRTRLLQRTPTTFELAGTCVRFDFHAGENGAMARIECRGNLPNLAPAWIRTS